MAGGATAGLDDIEEAGIDFEGFGVAGELGASDSVGEEVEAREGLALTEGPSLELTAVGFAGISGALEVAAGENCLGLGEAVGSAFATPTTPADSDITSAATRLAAREDRIDHNLSGRGHENATPGSSHFLTWFLLSPPGSAVAGRFAVIRR